MLQNKKLARNTVVLSLCTILNKGLLFVMIPLFTRWLSVEEYGIYDVLETYIALLIPIITLSSSNAVFRLSVDCDDKKNEYISNGLYIVLVNLVIGVGLITCFSIKNGWDLYFPFCLLLIGEVLDNYFQGYLRALKKLNLYGVCKSAPVLFTALTVTIFVRFMHMGLRGLIYGYAGGFFLSSILIIVVTKFWQYINLKRFSLHRIKELVSYSWALIPNDIAWWVINVSDRQIINVFLGGSFNGIYAVAHKIPNLCSAVFGVFNISWQESAIEALSVDGKREYFNNVYNKMIQILLALCTAILSCNFIFFDYVFDIRYSDARLYTPILMVAVVFSMMALFYGGIQISLKKPQANGLSTVVGALVNLVVHLGLVNYIGLYAAAISTVCANIAVYMVRRILLRKEYVFKLNKKQFSYIGIFAYYVVVASIKQDLIFNIVHFLMASIVFMYSNLEFIKGVLRKIKKL